MLPDVTDVLSAGQQPAPGLECFAPHSLPAQHYWLVCIVKSSNPGWP